MELFNVFGEDISYKDMIQLDGALYGAHANYDEAPVFNGIDCRELINGDSTQMLSPLDNADDNNQLIPELSATEQQIDSSKQIMLWKQFWLEYINAFDQLTKVLPRSVVTAYIGRQTLEVGFKYLLFIKNGEVTKTHNLKLLADDFIESYKITDDYMEYVPEFCEIYSWNIEDGNIEYFRYPRYRNSYFAGSELDIK